MEPTTPTTESQREPVDYGLLHNWVPENANITVAARRTESGHWESVVPAFGIAGQGATPRAALDNALDLLFDYFALMARDGKTFEESVRPIPRSTYAAIAAVVLGNHISRRLRRRREVFRLPLQSRIAH
jgi:hypothetical protein